DVAPAYGEHQINRGRSPQLIPLLRADLPAFVKLAATRKSQLANVIEKARLPGVFLKAEYQQIAIWQQFGQLLQKAIAAPGRAEQGDAHGLMLAFAGQAIFAHGIARFVHDAKVHSSQIFADNAERQKLRAGKNADDRRQKREPLHWCAFNQITPDDPDQHQNTEGRQQKTEQTGKLERQHTEAGHHVQRVDDKFAQGVV